MEAMKRFKAVVIGGTGYGGAELIRRLLIHPEVELVRVVAVDHVGEPLGAVHPPLTGRSPLRFENVPPDEAARGADVALLALPHKVSAHHAPAIVAAGVKVVDMSGDFRLRDAAAYERYYGAKHPHPELLGTLRLRPARAEPRGDPRGARVASPGCFATTIELGAAAAGARGQAGGRGVHVVGMTGSSGSGIAPTAGTHHPVRAVNLKPYKPLEHQHTPEILETLAAAGAPGVELRLRAGVGAAVARHPRHQLRRAARRHDRRVASTALYADAYAREPFVRFVRDRLPEVAAVAGSNYAEVGFTLGARRRVDGQTARWRSSARPTT